MEKENGEKEHRAVGENSFRILCHDRADDETDDHHGKKRTGRQNQGREARRLVVQKQSEQHRREDDLRGGEENARGIDRHVSTGQPLREQGSHDHRGERRAHGHDHGQRHIGPREVSHHVRGRAARTAGHEDESHREGRRQGEEFGHAPTEQGHDGVLRGEAERHRARHAQHRGKILHAQGQSHSEHDHGESPDDPRAREPGKKWRVPEREQCGAEHPRGEPIGGFEEQAAHGSASSKAFEGV